MSISIVGADSHCRNQHSVNFCYIVSYCSRKPTGTLLWLSEHSEKRRGCAHTIFGPLGGEWKKLPLKIQQLFTLRNWFKGGYNSHMQNFFTSRANLGSCPSEFVIFSNFYLGNYPIKSKKLLPARAFWCQRSVLNQTWTGIQSRLSWAGIPGRSAL